ncbi:ATP-binding protein [Streptomyces sp. NPDC013181]|uniref:ATP-binding protein n=1 Tax=Streptomyces sp. NPDC013181 TaxID=3364864 RepID=UPI0036CAD44F
MKEQVGRVTDAGGEGFGPLLRQWRLEASLTIEALAEASGVSVRGIGDLERGRRATPQRGTVAALADGLGLGEAERERLLAAARAGRQPRPSTAGVCAFPRGIDHFVGREAELARLTALAGQPASGQPVVVALPGPPGTGKTTLALHAARMLADRFPDAQLMVDLRGMDDAPPAPAELMLRVLKGLGVPDRDLAKAGPQGHPELYRQTLAERRCLLVLDNARDEAQVRPLLPSAGAGMVIITSRRMLTGLESVHRLPLGELSPAESAVFLTPLVGQERADADPDALAEVAERCAHLPLALRVAGNWLATRTGWTVRRLADRLALEERRLDTLAAGDLHLSAAFDLSYRQLTPKAARLFRLLSVVDGPDVDAAGAAQLTGRPPFDTEDTLEELVESGLLGTDRDRYRFHDLLRLYARNRLRATSPTGPPRRPGRHCTAGCSKPRSWPGAGTNPTTAPHPPPGRASSTCPPPNTPASGSRPKATTGSPPCARPPRQGSTPPSWRSPRPCTGSPTSGSSGGHWPEVFRTAVHSAQALGDPLAEATQLNYHAWALLMCEGRRRDSVERSAQALAAARRAEHLPQQGWAYYYSAWALGLLGDYAGAARHNREAATLFETVGDVHGTLQAMSNHSHNLSLAGRQEEAIAEIQRTLTFLDQAGDRIEPHIAAFSRARLQMNIGFAHSALENWSEAAVHLRAALDLWRDSANPGPEGQALVRLGDALLAAGRRDEARTAFTRAVSLGTATDPTSLAAARARLDDLRTTGTE